MALSIPVSDAAWSENNFSLGGRNYRFVFSFNERDQRWRFDIYLNDTPVITGVKIVENQFFLRRYRLEDFSHGDIGCLRLKQDLTPVGRDNLGVGKSYELIYLTNAEIGTVLSESDE